MEELEESIDMRKTRSMKNIGIASLIIGTAVTVFGWIVLPIISGYFHYSQPLPILELIIIGLLIFIFGFLLFDYSEKKYNRLKKKYWENRGIPITP